MWTWASVWNLRVLVFAVTAKCCPARNITCGYQRTHKQLGIVQLAKQFERAIAIAL